MTGSPGSCKSDVILIPRPDLEEFSINERLKKKDSYFFGIDGAGNSPGGGKQTKLPNWVGKGVAAGTGHVYEQQFTDANSRLPRNVSRRIVATGGGIHWLGR